MSLVLVRIDDRLIHGQVVVGWASVLHPDRILLASDEVATVDWQRTIYLSAVPEELKASVLTLDDTVKTLKNKEYNDERVLLLVDSPKSVLYLVEKGLEISRVNVGGMHFKPGKNQVTPFIFVDQNDIEAFQHLYKREIELEGRDVPNRASVNIPKVLGLENEDAG